MVVIVENWYWNTVGGHRHTQTHTQLTCGLTSDLFCNLCTVANTGTKTVVYPKFSLNLHRHYCHFWVSISPLLLPKSISVLSLFFTLYVYLLVSLESRSDTKAIFSFPYFNSTQSGQIGSWLLNVQYGLRLYQYKIPFFSTKLKPLPWTLSCFKNMATLYF